MRRHVRRKTSAFLRPESFRHLNERCMTHDLTVVQSSAERFQVTRKLRSGKAFFALIRDNDSTISNSIFVLKIVSNS